MCIRDRLESANRNNFSIAVCSSDNSVLYRKLMRTEIDVPWFVSNKDSCNHLDLPTVNERVGQFNENYAIRL